MPKYMVEQLTEQASLADVMGIVSYLHFEGDHVLRPSDAHDYISQFVQMVKQEALASPNYDIRIRALVNMNGQQMNSLLSLCEETLDSDWKISPDIDRQYLLSKAHSVEPHHGNHATQRVNVGNLAQPFTGASFSWLRTRRHHHPSHL